VQDDAAPRDAVDSPPRDALIINARVRIPLSELSYETTRSSGAGGQHVNKNETAVALLFDLARSPSLNDAERARAQAKLASRINTAGVLRVESQESRSQVKNREEVTRRFAQLLRDALLAPKKRIKTKPPRRSIEKRLVSKKHRGAIKRDRRGDADA
jgi:ribosome-associated protein